MEERVYHVQGEGVEAVSDRLYQALDVTTSHVGDGFEVMIIERFDLWRTASNMQVTVVVDEHGRDDADVRVVVGGGATGLFRITLGSERKVLRKVTRDIETVFEELTVTVRSSG